MQIRINADTCIKCGNCAAVCPALIFRQKEPKTPIDIARPEACIKCGHCVDVCPTNSIKHEFFPSETLHDIDYSNMPSPQQLMNLIHSRRSNRTFLNKEIPAEHIDMMREAALYAPSAANNRMLEMNVICDSARIDEVIRFTIETLEAKTDVLGPKYVPIIRSARRAYENGFDPILRNAPYVMVFSSDYNFGTADCNLAYQNASLMAQSLGISQVYLGFAYTASQLADPERVKEVFGVRQKVQALMAFGLPRLRYKRYAERRELGK